MTTFDRYEITTTHDHLDCDQCAKALDDARNMAKLTGSTGATASRAIPDEPDHVATWTRGAPIIEGVPR